MPFKSKAQARFMFAKKPGIAQEFASKTKSIKALPNKVGKKKGKKGKKSSKPGDMFNKFKSKKGKLRPASVVVKDEQNSSHQFFGKKKK